MIISAPLPQIQNTIFDRISDALFIWTIDENGIPGNFVDVNRAAVINTGYDSDELLTMTPLQLLAPGFPDPLMEKRFELLETKKLRFERMHITKDGRSMPVEMCLDLVETDGQPLVIGFAHDISEMTSDRNELIESERYLQLILAQVPALLWTTDTTLKILDLTGSSMGDTASDHTMYSRETKIYEFFWGMSPEDSVPIEVHKKALRGEAGSYETYWRGMNWKACVEPLHDEKGKIIGTIGIALDITGQKKIEEELRHKTEEVRFITSHVPALFWSTDMEIRLTGLFGSLVPPPLHDNPDQAIGRPLAEILTVTPDADLALESHRKALAGESSMYILRIDGVRMKCNLEPLRDNTGAIIGAVGAATVMRNEGSVVGCQ